MNISFFSRIHPRRAIAFLCVMSILLGFVAFCPALAPVEADGANGWGDTGITVPSDYIGLQPSTQGVIRSYIRKKADVSAGDGYFIFSDPGALANFNTISYTPMAFFCAAYTHDGDFLGEVLMTDDNIMGDAFQSRRNPIDNSGFGEDASGRPLTGTVIPVNQVLEQFQIEYKSLDKKSEVAEAFQDGGFAVFNAVLTTTISGPPDGSDFLTVDMTGYPRNRPWEYPWEVYGIEQTGWNSFYRHWTEVDGVWTQDETIWCLSSTYCQARLSKSALVNGKQKTLTAALLREDLEKFSVLTEGAVPSRANILAYQETHANDGFKLNFIEVNPLFPVDKSIADEAGKMTGILAVQPGTDAPGLLENITISPPGGGYTNWYTYQNGAGQTPIVTYSSFDTKNCLSSGVFGYGSVPRATMFNVLVSFEKTIPTLYSSAQAIDCNSSEALWNQAYPMTFSDTYHSEGNGLFRASDGSTMAANGGSAHTVPLNKISSVSVTDGPGSYDIRVNFRDTSAYGKCSGGVQFPSWVSGTSEVVWYDGKWAEDRLSVVATIPRKDGEMKTDIYLREGQEAVVLSVYTSKKRPVLRAAGLNKPLYSGEKVNLPISFTCDAAYGTAHEFSANVWQDGVETQLALTGTQSADIGSSLSPAEVMVNNWLVPSLNAPVNTTTDTDLYENNRSNQVVLNAVGKRATWDAKTAHRYPLNIIQSDLCSSVLVTVGLVSYAITRLPDGSYEVKRTESGSTSTSYTTNPVIETVGDTTFSYQFFFRNLTSVPVSMKGEYTNPNGINTDVGADTIEANASMESSEHTVTVNGGNEVLLSAKTALNNGIEDWAANYGYEASALNNEMQFTVSAKNNVEQVSLKTNLGVSDVKQGMVSSDSNFNTHFQRYNAGRVYTGEKVGVDVKTQGSITDNEHVYTIAETAQWKTDRYVPVDGCAETISQTTLQVDVSAEWEFLVKKHLDGVPVSALSLNMVAAADEDIIFSSGQQVQIDGAPVVASNLRASIVAEKTDGTVSYRFVSGADEVEVYDGSYAVGKEPVRIVPFEASFDVEYGTYGILAWYENTTGAENLTIDCKTGKGSEVSIISGSAFREDLGITTLSVSRPNSNVFSAKIGIDNGLGLNDDNYAYESNSDDNVSIMRLHGVSRILSVDSGYRYTDSKHDALVKEEYQQDGVGQVQAPYNSGKLYAGERVQTSAYFAPQSSWTANDKTKSLELSFSDSLTGSMQSVYDGQDTVSGPAWQAVEGTRIVGKVTDSSSFDIQPAFRAPDGADFRIDPVFADFSTEVVPSDLKTVVMIADVDDGTEYLVSVYENGIYRVVSTDMSKSGLFYGSLESPFVLNLPEGHHFNISSKTVNQTAPSISGFQVAAALFTTLGSERASHAATLLFNGEIVDEKTNVSVGYAGAEIIYTARSCLDNGLGFVADNYDYETIAYNNEIAIKIRAQASQFTAEYAVQDTNHAAEVSSQIYIAKNEGLKWGERIQGYNDGTLYSGEKVSFKTQWTSDNSLVLPANLYGSVSNTLSSLYPSNPYEHEIGSGWMEVDAFMGVPQDGKSVINMSAVLLDGEEESSRSVSTEFEVPTVVTNLRAALIIQDISVTPNEVYKIQAASEGYFVVTYSSVADALAGANPLRIDQTMTPTVQLSEGHSCSVSYVYYNDTDVAVDLVGLHLSEDTTVAAHSYVQAEEVISTVNGGDTTLTADVAINNGKGMTAENKAYESCSWDNAAFVNISILPMPIEPSIQVSYTAAGADNQIVERAYSGQVVALNFHYEEESDQSAEYLIWDDVSGAWQKPAGFYHYNESEPNAIAIGRGETFDTGYGVFGRACTQQENTLDIHTSEKYTSDIRTTYEPTQDMVLNVSPSDVMAVSAVLCNESGQVVSSGELPVGMTVYPKYTFKNNTNTAVTVFTRCRKNGITEPSIPADAEHTIAANETLVLTGTAFQTTPGASLTFDGAIYLADAFRVTGSLLAPYDVTLKNALLNIGDDETAYAEVTQWETVSSNNRTQSAYHVVYDDDPADLRLEHEIVSGGVELPKDGDIYKAYSGQLMDAKYLFGTRDGVPRDATCFAYFRYGPHTDTLAYRLSKTLPWLTSKNSIRLRNTTAFPCDESGGMTSVCDLGGGKSKSLNTTLHVYPVNLTASAIRLENARHEPQTSLKVGQALTPVYSIANTCDLPVTVQYNAIIASGATQAEARANLEARRQAVKDTAEEWRSITIAANDSVATTLPTLTVETQDKYFAASLEVYQNGLAVTRNVSYETNGEDNTLMREWTTLPMLTAEFVEPNSPYRTETEVVASFRVWNNSYRDVTLDSHIIASLKVDQQYETFPITANDKQYVVPAGESTLVWFNFKISRWMAVDNLQLTFDLDSTGVTGEDDAFRVVSANWPLQTAKRSQTSDTTYTPGRPLWYDRVAIPDNTVIYPDTEDLPNATWKYWVQEGDELVEKEEYGSVCQVWADIRPSHTASSSSGIADGYYYMRSGYGFETSITGTGVDANTNTTVAQHAYMIFPEFNYEADFGDDTLWMYEALDSGFRVPDDSVDPVNNGYFGLFQTLRRTEDGFTNAENPAMRNYLHYTPLWFPDDLYTCYVYVCDKWTPAGQLSGWNRTNSINIIGDLYDDWYIAWTY